MLKGVLVDAALEKYGLPKWMKPYVLDYLKGNSFGAVKYAASFVNVGRKKGVVTKREIILPNGFVFKKDQMIRLASLFFYGEERISKISMRWATSDSDLVQPHNAHFMTMHEIESRRARAIKNLIDGLGGKPVRPTDELAEVFDYIEGLRTWEQRIVAKKILLYNSFAIPFGYVFYKVFYPVSPEFMRSFGTAFINKDREEISGQDEAARILQSKKLSDEEVLRLSEEILTLIARSINSEMDNARNAGIEKETILLRDVSVACPLHRLEELGVKIDVEKEMDIIKKRARSGKSSKKSKRND